LGMLLQGAFAFSSSVFVAGFSALSEKVEAW